MNLSDTSLLKTNALIDGNWVDADDGSTRAVQNPANGEKIALIANCGRSETQAAIKAAERAFHSWKKTTSKERSALLMDWHDLIVDNADDLALILTSEQGKPLTEARGEIIYGANYVKWFAEEAKRIYGDTLPGTSNDARVVVIKQPIGVVACITPWNFPNAMLARKLAPALAAGNTVVCKPANATPLSAFALGELAIRAGIPKGVINILGGNTAAIGAELTSNDVVRKLSFTGSTQVGKKLMADCASTVKRTSMELGGNAPFIVFSDSDIDAAITGLIACKFRNAGQTCVCANRVFVQSDIYERFLEAFKSAVTALRLGDGRQAGIDVGPVIDSAAAAGINDLIKDAVDSGASLIQNALPSDLSDSRYVPPTIVTGVTNRMRLFQEEIFGPVAPLISFDTEEEVIEMANDTEVGLAAYFFSRDIGRIWRVSEALEYGMVGINTGAISNEMAPFGGVKESGQGREGSKYGLDDYLEIKSMTMGGINS